MRFVFLIDLFETLDLKKDTSYLLMQGAQARGHEIYILYKNDITLEDQELFFHASRLEPSGNGSTNQNNQLIRGKKSKISYLTVKAFIIRIDPPFDEKYIQLTWLLELIQNKVFILNDPEGIRNTNEKISVQKFPHLIPPTLITANPQDYDAFLKENRKVVVKPTNGLGGKNIFITRTDDLNSRVIFDTVLETSGYAIIQKYIPEAELGDKRILLLNGEFLGAIMRVHGGKDHRNNLAVGGVAKATKLTARDQEIIQKIRPFLIEKKLYFVGIDILGSYLTEINVTSPTCLKEMNQVYKIDIEKQVIKFVEEQVISFQ